LDVNINHAYVYSSQIWPSLITFLILPALAAYAWSRRGVPGALPFAIGSLLAALWAGGSVMEYAAVGLADKIMWVKVQAVWQMPAITAITCFSLEYAWPGCWLTRRNLAWLALAPLLVLAMTLCNNRWHLMWSGFGFDGAVVPVRAVNAYGTTYADHGTFWKFTTGRR
jgi:hypothetical protein